MERILYCNIDYYKNYNGPEEGHVPYAGKYTKNNIGHEVNNFTPVNGFYYGYVQSTNDTINISKKFGCDKNAEYADHVTVIFYSRVVQCIVGYYYDARVFRKHQIDFSLQPMRYYPDYNISTEKAVLIPEDKRSFRIDGFGQSNVWYGNEATNAAVKDYIEQYEYYEPLEFIQKTESFKNPLEGIEKEAVIKIRVNQGVFRSKMLEKYKNRCCLCDVENSDMLIASHIKPWSVSNSAEKLSEYNGLLLCPAHDRLFDKGYISFDDDGHIIISDQLGKTDRMFLNVTEYMKIKVDGDMAYYLDYHRKNIFKK